MTYTRDIVKMAFGLVKRSSWQSPERIYPSVIEGVEGKNTNLPAGRQGISYRSEIFLLCYTEEMEKNNLQPESENERRRKWRETLKYWCKEAETSPRAAEIEAVAVGEGFEGENIGRQQQQPPPPKEINSLFQIKKLDSRRTKVR